jgi:hypothetical protein
MRTFTRGLVAAACTVAVLGLAAGAAQAQFQIDHYKVYPIDPVPSGLPVDLIDQFGPSSHVLIQRDKFANPVQKFVAGVPHGDIIRPLEHLSWWKITEEVLPLQTIHVTNQFGGDTWEIGNAQYLLVPASKNNPFPFGIELDQHYKCYDATAPKPVDINVDLFDQFGTESHTVLFPRYFCNPVEKTGPPPLTPSGPIPLPTEHLACYDITPGLGNPNVQQLADQVVPGLLTHDPNPAEMLCVPSHKRLDIPVLSPWGLLAFGVLLTGAMYATIRRRGASLKA